MPGPNRWKLLDYLKHVLHGSRSPDYKPALEGAFKYVVLSAVATILMLGGVAMLLLVVGQTSFGAIHSELKSDNWVVLAKATP